jgi:hypothetical protein
MIIRLDIQFVPLLNVVKDKSVSLQQPPHPINMKLKDDWAYPIDQKYFVYLFLPFLIALIFPIYYLLFLFHLYINWGLFITFHAPASMGSYRKHHLCRVPKTHDKVKKH